MSQTKQLIETLSAKADALITKQKNLQVVIQQKDQSIDSLRTQLAEKDEKIERLTHELTELKNMPTSSQTANDPIEVQEKIDKMVREIDECISLLKA